MTMRHEGRLAERARHALRDRLAPMLEGRRYGGVLLALILGDQRAIAAQDVDEARAAMMRTGRGARRPGPGRG